MNFHDPRWLRTTQVVMLAIFSFWIGRLDAGTTQNTRYWLLMVVYGVAILGSIFLLLRDIWRPSA